MMAIRLSQKNLPNLKQLGPKRHPITIDLLNRPYIDHSQDQYYDSLIYAPFNEALIATIGTLVQYRTLPELYGQPRCSPGRTVSQWQEFCHTKYVQVKVYSFKYVKFLIITRVIDALYSSITSL